VTALAAALLLLGTLLTVLAGLGTLKFPDVFARMHAATKASSLGLALIVLGAAVRLPGPGTALKLLLVIGLQFFTAPIAAAMIGRAAHREGLAMAEVTSVDELAEADRADAEDG
jgi:multicomponent Na+:H+ antiporter subunit G